MYRFTQMCHARRSHVLPDMGEDALIALSDSRSGARTAARGGSRAGQRRAGPTRLGARLLSARAAADPTAVPPLRIAAASPRSLLTGDDTGAHRAGPLWRGNPPKCVITRGSSGSARWVGHTVWSPDRSLTTYPTLDPGPIMPTPGCWPGPTTAPSWNGHHPAGPATHPPPRRRIPTSRHPSEVRWGTAGCSETPEAGDEFTQRGSRPLITLPGGK